MKICDKVFKGGIDIIVDQTRDDISFDFMEYIRENNLIIKSENDCRRLFYHDIPSSFASIKKDIDANEKIKWYTINMNMKDAKEIIDQLNDYLKNNDISDIISKGIHIFLIVHIGKRFNVEDFHDIPYHFFYKTEGKNIFGEVLLDVEDKEVFKGWKN